MVNLAWVIVAMNDDKKNKAHKLLEKDNDVLYKALTSKDSRLAADKMFAATADELADSYVDQESASIKKATENRDE